MATNIPPHNLEGSVQRPGVPCSTTARLPLEKLLGRYPRARLPDRRRDPQLGRRDRGRSTRPGRGRSSSAGPTSRTPTGPNALLITSIPYGIEKDALVERIGELIGQGPGPATDQRQGSEHRRHPDPAGAEARLERRRRRWRTCSRTRRCRSNYNVNLTCLLPAEGAEVAVPRRLDLKSILQQFLDFRMEVVTRRLRYELKNLLDRIHILEGFAIVFNNLDEAIRIIRGQRRQGRRRAQADRTGSSSPRSRPTRSSKRSSTGLGKLEIQDILAELEEKTKRAAEIQRLLDDEPARWEIIRGELKQIAKTFGEPRRTQIEAPAAPIEFREEDYIVDEDAWVIVTRDGWTKRQKSFTDVASIRVRDDDRSAGSTAPGPGRRSRSSPIAASRTRCGSTTSR